MEKPVTSKAALEHLLATQQLNHCLGAAAQIPVIVGGTYCTKWFAELTAATATSDTLPELLRVGGTVLYTYLTVGAGAITAATIATAAGWLNEKLHFWTPEEKNAFYNLQSFTKRPSWFERRVGFELVPTDSLADVPYQANYWSMKTAFINGAYIGNAKSTEKGKVELTLLIGDYAVRAVSKRNCELEVYKAAIGETKWVLLDKAKNTNQLQLHWWGPAVTTEQYWGRKRKEEEAKLAWQPEPAPVPVRS